MVTVFGMRCNPKPDLVVPDVMFPGKDGVTLLKLMKRSEEFQDIPVIMATAKGSEYDKIQSLDLGADDYLVKPFCIMEMVSRVKAVLRRCKLKVSPNLLKLDGLVLNPDEHTVAIDGERVILTYKEYELLHLLLSQLDEGVEFPAEQVDLLQLAEDVKEILTPSAAEKQGAITVSGSGFTVMGVRRMPQEIIYNLCDNAIKHNVSGGSVTIHAENNRLPISDTGIGIPAEHKDRIFERFCRVDKSHSKASGGTGRGLSIVKHAAAYHKAEICLESIPGKRTTITIQFLHGSGETSPGVFCVMNPAVSKRGNEYSSIRKWQNSLTRWRQDEAHTHMVFVCLGYISGEYPETKPRNEDRILYIDKKP